jgi:hypothetical protein
MKAKGIVSTVLLLFVGVSVAYLVVNELRPRPAADEPAQAGPTATSMIPSATEPASVETQDEQSGHKLIAYYFHGDKRCRSCLTIEAYAQEALEEAFPDAIALGELEWQAVNTDEPENEHFAKDYELTTSSLVLVDTQDGSRLDWRKLDEVWNLIDDKLAFQAYVEGEALAYLEDGS